MFVVEAMSSFSLLWSVDLLVETHESILGSSMGEGKSLCHLLRLSSTLGISSGVFISSELVFLFGLGSSISLMINACYRI